MTKARVSTEQFEFSHGRVPRGFGVWMFGFGSADAPLDEAFESSPCSFSQAKAQALREARRRGFDGLVHVLP